MGRPSSIDVDVAGIRERKSWEHRKINERIISGEHAARGRSWGGNNIVLSYRSGGGRDVTFIMRLEEVAGKLGKAAFYAHSQLRWI